MRYLGFVIATLTAAVALVLPACSNAPAPSAPSAATTTGGNDNGNSSGNNNGDGSNNNTVSQDSGSTCASAASSGLGSNSGATGLNLDGSCATSVSPSPTTVATAASSSPEPTASPTATLASSSTPASSPAPTPSPSPPSNAAYIDSLLLPAAEAACHQQGLLYNRLTSACDTAKFPASFTCDRAGILAAYGNHPTVVTLLNSMDQAGDLYNQCGVEGTTPVVFFLCPTFDGGTTCLNSEALKARTSTNGLVLATTCIGKTTNAAGVSCAAPAPH